MPLTYVIIIFTCLVSITSFNNYKATNDLIFWPAEIRSRNQYYRFLTAGLLHADWMHLIFNMLTLYFFGRLVEPVFQQLWSKYVFLLFYLGALVFSNIPSYFKHKNDFSYRALGASGAISAVLFSAIIFDPWIGIGLFFIPIPIPGFIFAILYLIFSAYMARRNLGNIGHDAHFWGAIFGFLFPLVLKPSLFSYFMQQLWHGRY